MAVEKKAAPFKSIVRCFFSRFVKPGHDEEDLASDLDRTLAETFGDGVRGSAVLSILEGLVDKLLNGLRMTWEWQRCSRTIGAYLTIQTSLVWGVFPLASSNPYP